MNSQSDSRIVHGTLIIENIPNSDAKKQTYAYLSKLFHKTPKEKLITLLKQPTPSLSLKTTEQKVAQIILKLNAMGVVARFASKESLKKEAVDNTPANMNQVKIAVLRGFQGRVPSIPVPLIYKIGLAITAFFMLLLPVIYFSFIIALAYALIWHIIDNISLFDSLQSVRGALILYVVPIIIGSLLLLFMVKPVFARRSKLRIRSRLDPSEEKFLHDYVKKIAQILGAPVPESIYTIMELNASAGLKSGLRGFFANELALSIGLPLIAGTNLHQLTEVIAHELGHFAQTTGMRLSYIIRNTNYWFARVVYEKDEWDDRIKKWSKEWDFRVSVILYAAIFFIWLTRKILWCLMWVGDAISCFMMRQMEFDADRYGVALIGADVFRSSSERIHILSIADRWAQNDLGMAWQEGRLVDDLPSLIATRAAQIPADKKEEYMKAMLSHTKHHLFSTHPTDAERIANARKYDYQPNFVLDTENSDIQKLLKQIKSKDPQKIYETSPPASILFKDFQMLCKSETHDYYGMVLFDVVPKDRLIPVENLIQHQDNEGRAHEAIDKIFFGLFNLYNKPMIFERPIQCQIDMEEAIRKIRNLKSSLQRENKNYETSINLFGKLEDRLLTLDRVEALVEAGFSIYPQDFKLSSADPEAIQNYRESAETEQKNVIQNLSNFENQAYEEIKTALSLLACPAFSERVGNTAPMIQDAEKWIAVWNGLVAKHVIFRELETEFQKIYILAHQLEDNGDNAYFINCLQERLRNGYHLLQDVKVGLADDVYPFDHADGDITVGHFLTGIIPPPERVGEIINKIENTIKRAYELMRRLMAQLSTITVKIESELGLIEK